MGCAYLVATKQLNVFEKAFANVNNVEVAYDLVEFFDVICLYGLVMYCVVIFVTVLEGLCFGMQSYFPRRETGEYLSVWRESDVG